MQEQKILIIDYGSQYTQLIARRIRENKTYCEVVTPAYLNNLKDSENIIGVVLSGGPNSTINDNKHDLNDSLFELDVPVLGICFGMQLICKKFGGVLEQSSSREYGKAKLDIHSKGKIFDGLSDSLEVWMSHGDSVTEVSDNLKIIASTNKKSLSAIKVNNKEIYGIQFHPEVTHTLDDGKIISNFVNKICNSRSQWTTKNIIIKQISQIKNKVGGDNVILGLSGGVDSSVSAAILHKAISNQLTCIFVDNGLLRLNERDQVKESFKDFEKIKIHYVDASKLFMKRLEGITEPEEKERLLEKRL